MDVSNSNQCVFNSQYFGRVDMPLNLRNTQVNHRNLDHMKLAAFACGNLFSKNNWTWEYIFEEKSLFKTSNNKNTSKITCYTISTSALSSTRGECRVCKEGKLKGGG